MFYWHKQGDKSFKIFEVDANDKVIVNGGPFSERYYGQRVVAYTTLDKEVKFKAKINNELIINIPKEMIKKTKDAEEVSKEHQAKSYHELKYGNFYDGANLELVRELKKNTSLIEFDVYQYKYSFDGFSPPIIKLGYQDISTAFKNIFSDIRHFTTTQTLQEIDTQLEIKKGIGLEFCIGLLAIYRKIFYKEWVATVDGVPQIKVVEYFYAYEKSKEWTIWDRYSAIALVGAGYSLDEAKAKIDTKKKKALDEESRDKAEYENSKTEAQEKQSPPEELEYRGRSAPNAAESDIREGKYNIPYGGFCNSVGTYRNWLGIDAAPNVNGGDREKDIEFLATLFGVNIKGYFAKDEANFYYSKKFIDEVLSIANKAFNSRLQEFIKTSHTDNINYIAVDKYVAIRLLFSRVQGDGRLFYTKGSSSDTKEIQTYTIPDTFQKGKLKVEYEEDSLILSAVEGKIESIGGVKVSNDNQIYGYKYYSEWEEKFKAVAFSMNENKITIYYPPKERFTIDINGLPAHINEKDKLIDIKANYEKPPKNKDIKPQYEAMTDIIYLDKNKNKIAFLGENNINLDCANFILDLTQFPVYDRINW